MDFLSGFRLKPAFYILGLPAYGALGTSIAVIALVFAALRNRRLSGSQRERADMRVGIVCIPMTLVLFQGGILLNELVLYGSSFTTLTSLAIDTLWIGFTVALFAIALQGGRGLPSSLLMYSLPIGLVLCSFSVSSLHHVLDKPLDIKLGTAATQTLLVVTVAGFSLLSPTIAGSLAAKHGLRFMTSQRLATTVAGLVLGGCLAVAFLVTPKDRFEESASFQPSRTSGANVILIVVDTLRADHLSCYGYARNTSPNLDEFSRAAVLFGRCYSPSNWTPPGHASIFTGRFPVSHGAHKARLGRGSQYPTCFPLANDETTLAEVLAQHGYRTAAFVANHVFVTRSYGLDQGFHLWFATPPKRTTPALLVVASKISDDAQKILVRDPVPCRRASDISQLALRWVRLHESQPFFLLLNLMDTHRPYSPPAPYNRVFDGRLPDFEPNFDDLRSGRTSFSQQEFDHIQAEYDGAVAYVDSVLGSFLETLERDGILSRSIVVVTSDHGEFLGEKGLLEHQIALYDPVIRVPLIIKPASGMPPPDLLDRTAQTIDIMPTVLDLLEITIPSSVQGTSLWSEDSHSIVAQHYADEHVENWFGGRFNVDQLALVSAGSKYIVSGSAFEELYDLESDPAEHANLSTRNAELLDRLRQELQRWRATVEVKVNMEGVAPEFNREQIRQLETLGYVTGGS